MDEPAEEKEETPKPTSPKDKTKLTKKQLTITIVLASIVVIIVGVLIYFWQQGNLNSKRTGFEADKKRLDEQIASQSAQLSKLEKTNADQKAKISFLEKSLQEATASARFEFGELTFASAKAEHFVYEDEGGPLNLVMVDVTMKNSTEQNLFLSAPNFKLKDASNKSYPQASEGMFNLPSGKVLIFDQQMAVGESVSGTLVFIAPKTINLFTLFYDSQQSTITIK